MCFNQLCKLCGHSSPPPTVFAVKRVSALCSQLPNRTTATLIPIIISYNMYEDNIERCMQINDQDSIEVM